jgi:colanic acid biosynthesis glycosyl transferase WcaI
VFPSKLYGVAAIGRPILFIGPRECEVARLVRQHDLGLAAERGDSSAIVEFIRGIAKDAAACARHAEHARQFAAQHGLERAVGQWSALLANVDACAVSAPSANTHAG